MSGTVTIPDAAYKKLQGIDHKPYSFPMPMLVAMYYVNSSFDFAGHIDTMDKLWGKPSELNNSFDNSPAWWEDFARRSGYITTGAGDPAGLKTAQALSNAYAGVPGTSLNPGNIIPALTSTAQAIGNTLPDPLQGLAQFLATITNPGTWIRVGLFMMALLLVIVGFLIIIHGNEATAGGVS